MTPSLSYSTFNQELYFVTQLLKWCPCIIFYWIAKDGIRALFLGPVTDRLWANIEHQIRIGSFPLNIFKILNHYSSLDSDLQKSFAKVSYTVEGYFNAKPLWKKNFLTEESGQYCSSSTCVGSGAEYFCLFSFFSSPTSPQCV